MNSDDKNPKRASVNEMVHRIMAADGVMPQEARELMAPNADHAWLTEIADDLEDQNYHAEAAFVRALINEAEPQ